MSILKLSYSLEELKTITNNLIEYINKNVKDKIKVELRTDKRYLYDNEVPVLFYELYVNNVYLCSDKDLTIIKERVYGISQFVACIVESERRAGDKPNVKQ